MQQQITLHPPTRETMRLIFELAIKGAEHPNTKANVINAYNFFEYNWIQEEMKLKDDSSKPVTPPSSKSAVEEHGFASQQAQAKRNARKAKRQAAQKPSQNDTEATKSDEETA